LAILENDNDDLVMQDDEEQIDSEVFCTEKIKSLYDLLKIPEVYDKLAIKHCN